MSAVTGFYYENHRTKPSARHWNRVTSFYDDVKIRELGVFNSKYYVIAVLFTQSANVLPTHLYRLDMVFRISGNYILLFCIDLFSLKFVLW